jgi:pimeloyl-ACP methyl ester carboxylesterase
MDIVLGPMRAVVDRPQTLKFAFPIVLLPELFSPPAHLSLIAGYLVSIGWQVITIDLHTPPSNQNRDDANFVALMESLETALGAVGNESIVIGHGFGGAAALYCARFPMVKAAVALAPMVPGIRSPLLARRTGFGWFRRSRPRDLPDRRELLQLVSGADAFQREALIGSFVTCEIRPALGLAANARLLSAAHAPRLIVCGDSDVFAPTERITQLAEELGAQCTILKSRGHWLVGGRALEPAIAEVQRFLVRELGEKLLLLYSDFDDSDQS